MRVFKIGKLVPVNLICQGKRDKFINREKTFVKAKDSIKIKSVG